MNKNKVGLVLGVFFAILHAAWALLVAIGSAQQLIDWVLPLHFLNVVYSLTSFSIGTAVILITLAFVGGYITGWLFALVWGWFGGK